jgi:uncharacterized protein (TIRG00374 family)
VQDGRNVNLVRASGSSPWRRRGLLLLKLGVSALLLWLLARGLDAAKLRAVLRQADPWLVGLALALLTTVPAISAPRWHAILRRLDRPLPFAALMRALYVGSFLSQVFPSSIGGDLWRVWFCTRAGVPPGAAAGSVVIERLAGLGATAIFFAASLPLLLAKVGRNPVATLLWTMFAAFIVAAGVFALVAVRPALVPRSGFWAALANLAQALARVMRSASLVGLMVATALVGQAVAILAGFALARALALPLTLADCTATLPPALLISLLPVSLGGWGVREGALVTLLGFYGVASELALMLSILFGLALLGSTLPGLVLWLWPFAPHKDAVGPGEDGYRA